MFFPNEASSDSYYAWLNVPLILREYFGETSASQHSIPYYLQVLEVDKDDPLESLPIPPRLPNPENLFQYRTTPQTHLIYAITWFGLAGALGIMTSVWARRNLFRGRL